MKKVSDVGRWPLAVGRWPLAVGRWPLAVGLTCALYYASAQPAQAGWEMKVVESGTYVITKMDGSYNVYDHTGRIGDEGWFGEAYVGTAEFPEGTTVHAKVNGEYSVRAVWKPSNPDDRPPKKAWFRLTARAYAYGTDSSSLSLPSDFEDSHIVVTGGEIGSKVIEKDEGASEYDLGSYEVTADATSSENESSFWFGEEAVAGGGLWAAPVDYSLSLYRVGAPEPKIEGAPGVTIDEDKDEWIGTDGTRHGHSRWSYTILEPVSADSFDYNEEQQTVSSVIVANRGANWSSSATWGWSPGGDRDQVNSTVVDSPDTGATYNAATVYDRPDLGDESPFGSRLVWNAFPGLQPCQYHLQSLRQCWCRRRSHIRTPLA